MKTQSPYSHSLDTWRSLRVSGQCIILVCRPFSFNFCKRFLVVICKRAAGEQVALTTAFKLADSDGDG